MTPSQSPTERINWIEVIRQAGAQAGRKHTVRGGPGGR